MHLAAAHAFLSEHVAFDRHEHTEDKTQPETVQAMQLALHLPKTDVPTKTALLEAAARAVVAVCLDDRVVVDDDWRSAFAAWYDHLIRKVARRARNQAWLNVQDLPGITAEQAGAEVRAFVPSSVSTVHPLLKKLQIKGTDVPDDPTLRSAPELGRPLIVINQDLEMTLGKAAAQVGHGSMLLAARMDLQWVTRWANDGFPLQVREAPARTLMELGEKDNAVIVRDAGYTEVPADSATVVALPEP